MHLFCEKQKPCKMKVRICQACSHKSQCFESHKNSQNSIACWNRTKPPEDRWSTLLREIPLTSAAVSSGIYVRGRRPFLRNQSCRGSAEHCKLTRFTNISWCTGFTSASVAPSIWDRFSLFALPHTQRLRAWKISKNNGRENTMLKSHRAPACRF